MKDKQELSIQFPDEIERAEQPTGTDVSCERMQKPADGAPAPDWWDSIDIDEYERMAGLGYTPRQMAMYFGIPYPDFIHWFRVLNSPVKYHFDRGKLRCDARVAMAQQRSAEMANPAISAVHMKWKEAKDYQTAISMMFDCDV